MISYKCAHCKNNLPVDTDQLGITIGMCPCKAAQEEFLLEHRQQIEAKRVHNRSLRSRDAIRKRVRSK